MRTDVIQNQTIQPDPWADRLLRTELKTLKREQEHLEQKQRERELSGWELQRIADIMDEIMELLPKISQATYRISARKA